MCRTTDTHSLITISQFWYLCAPQRLFVWLARLVGSSGSGRRTPCDPVGFPTAGPGWWTWNRALRRSQQRNPHLPTPAIKQTKNGWKNRFLRSTTLQVSSHHQHLAICILHLCPPTTTKASNFRGDCRNGVSSTQLQRHWATGLRVTNGSSTPRGRRSTRTTHTLWISRIQTSSAAGSGLTDMFCSEHMLRKISWEFHAVSGTIFVLQTPHSHGTPPIDFPNVNFEPNCHRSTSGMLAWRASAANFCKIYKFVFHKKPANCSVANKNIPPRRDPLCIHPWESWRAKRIWFSLSPCCYRPSLCCGVEPSANCIVSQSINGSVWFCSSAAALKHKRIPPTLTQRWAMEMCVQRTQKVHKTQTKEKENCAPSHITWDAAFALLLGQTNGEQKRITRLVFSNNWRHVKQQPQKPSRLFVVPNYSYTQSQSWRTKPAHGFVLSPQKVCRPSSLFTAWDFI